MSPADLGGREGDPDVASLPHTAPPPDGAAYGARRHGIALMYHGNSLSQWIIRLEGGVHNRGIVHRVAASC